MDTKLSNEEFDLVEKAIESILMQPVENIELENNIPIIDEVTDSNKVFKGKLSVLFVDMRKSTDLTDEIKSKKMVKVYRSFIRSIIQAIRYSGGYSRQFAGDGIMAVFQDSEIDGINTLSSQKAIMAARYIMTIVDFCLNHMLKKHMDGLSIACGTGICTGTIMITKVGMRGKEHDDTIENEVGIVWVGSTTNKASRFCSIADSGEILIDEVTFKESLEDELYWSKCTRVKADKVYEGYVSSDYYLNLENPKEITPIKVTNDSSVSNTFIKSIFEETKKEALKLVDEISQKSAELSLKLDVANKREELLRKREYTASQIEMRLNQLESSLKKKQEELDLNAQRNREKLYQENIDIIQKAHCKKNFVLEMGKDFWLNQIRLVIQLGNEIGLSEIQVKSKICYYLVSIYNNLEMYEEEYYALCVQAEYGSWIIGSLVENVVRKTSRFSQLKDIIEKRLKTSLMESTRNDLIECASKLKSMGY